MAAKHNVSDACISVYIFNSKMKTKTKIFAVGRKCYDFYPHN